MFRINDCEKYGLALQTIAGAGLRNIVVSTSDVATELFSQKAFNGFEKLMPIDRINGRIELAPTVKKIKQLTGDKAELALNLITYNKTYEKVLANMFGSIFVCDDQTTARKLCYENNGIGRFNCITLQGDLYKTDGVMSGGSQTQ